MIAKTMATAPLQDQPSSNGHAYANVQFETDAAASESTCGPSALTGCAVPAPGSPGAFYPYFTQASVGGKLRVGVRSDGERRRIRYLSTTGGHSFHDFVSPTCAAQAITGLSGGPRPDCDPGARFVTPLTMDHQNKNVWLIGGEDVWVTSAGWQTSCTNSACSWQKLLDTGAGHAVTALSSANGGKVIYAAWVGGGGNPGPAFASGIATNYGGSWHQVNTTGLPNRFIAGVTVDPNNPAHAYAVFNGYSRRFVPGGGVGHLFETTDGGQTWTDISGNLPDIASDALVLVHGKLALATDAGMFTAAAGGGAGTSWSRLGTGLPNASVNDVTVGPHGYIYAGTHGRGIWRIPF